MTPDPEDLVELSSVPRTPAASPPPPGAHPHAHPHAHAGADPTPSDAPAGRPYLRLWFRCANQYARAYRHADGSAYSARCPRCGQQAYFRVGPGGTSQRFFEMSCQ